MHKSRVPVEQKANGAEHKIAFLANGSNLNNVKWVCNDFETRPGAIDRLGGKGATALMGSRLPCTVNVIGLVE